MLSIASAHWSQALAGPSVHSKVTPTAVHTQDNDKASTDHRMPFVRHVKDERPIHQGASLSSLEADQVQRILGNKEKNLLDVLSQISRTQAVSASIMLRPDRVFGLEGRMWNIVAMAKALSWPGTIYVYLKSTILSCKCGQVFLFTDGFSMIMTNQQLA